MPKAQRSISRNKLTIMNTVKIAEIVQHVKALEKQVTVLDAYISKLEALLLKANVVTQSDLDAAADSAIEGPLPTVKDAPVEAAAPPVIGTEL